VTQSILTMSLITFWVGKFQSLKKPMEKWSSSQI